jgi:hypothetical protein
MGIRIAICTGAFGVLLPGITVGCGPARGVTALRPATAYLVPAPVQRQYPLVAAGATSANGVPLTVAPGALPPGPVMAAPTTLPNSAYRLPPAGSTVVTSPGAVPVVAPQPLVSGPVYYVQRPVIPGTSAPRTVYYGTGIVGQPKLYVSGQPIRNALRYLSP